MGNKQSRCQQHTSTHDESIAIKQLEKLESWINKKARIDAIEYILSTERFDPTKEALPSLIRRLEDKARLMQFNDVPKLKKIFASLLPLDVFRHCYIALPELLRSDNDWDGFCYAMIESVHPISTREKYRTLLMNSTQGNRSVQKFIDEIEYFADMAYVHSNEMADREKNGQEAFFRGINSKYRDDIREKGFRHLGNIYAYALQIAEDDDNDNEPFLIAAITDPGICYFARERKEEVESLKRESHSIVTTNCGGELTSMIDLVKRSGQHFGTVNELELVLARGAGIFADLTPQYVNRHFVGQFVCSQHLDELSRRWSSKEWTRHIRRKNVKRETKNVCGITTHDREVTKGSVTLNKTQAHKYLHHNHRLLHVGIQICPAHAAEIDQLPDVDTEDQQENNDEPMDMDFNDDNPEVVEAKKADVQSYFSAFAEKAGVKGLAPSLTFGSDHKDTKMRKVCAMKRLFKVMVSVVAPNDEEEFMQLYLESLMPNAWLHKSESQLSKVFKVVAEQYEKAEDRRTKEIILSSIVNLIGPTELRNYIPGLSSRKYYNAKKRALSTKQIDEPEIRRCRYEPIKINYFIAFITSPLVSTGLPYGERRVKTSDGSYLSIANTIRLHRNAEILKMYKKHMEDIGKKHLILKDTVANGILNKCAATRRHALTCVDYYMADGADAFEDIEDIINTLQGMALLDADMAKLWKYNVSQSKLYLKTDFRMHLKSESQVIDHCYVHSLSDSTDTNFKYTGKSHSHTVRCPRCVMMETTFESIQSLVGSLSDGMDKSNPAMKTVSEMVHRMEQNVERIMEMKKHLVRAGYTDMERTRIISELNDGEAFVTMDYAQKYLATYKWESQRKYFGKRGFPWHIFHVIAKINGEYIQHSFVHVLYTKKQDNHSVIQMLDHVLSKLHDVKITGIHLRADNAGAYHSLGTVASIPYLSEKNKVKVLSLSFSEAQNGKSSCDRVAAQVKRKLRDYVARGKNITNPKDLFEGISASKLRGLSVYLGRVKREKTEKLENDLVKLLHPKMNGISGYGHFAFDGNTVTTWKMNGIGRGKLFKDLSGFKRVMKIEEEGGFLPSLESAEADEASMKKGQNPERFWTGYLSKKDKTVEEPDDVDEIDHNGQETEEDHKKEKGLFECNECGSTFIRYGNLINHLDVGRHRIRPQKVHLYDFALQLFKQKLEDIQAHNSILAEVSEAMTDMDHGTDHSYKEGWALKGKRKHVEYSKKAKKFAQKFFEQGEKNGRKMDPAEVERLMKEDDSIKPFERMNAQQIRSFFGNLCKAKKAETSRQVTSNDNEDEDWEDLDDEDVENIDDFGRELDDVIEDIIEANFDKLFDGEDQCGDDEDD